MGKDTSNFQWEVDGQRSGRNRGICIVGLVMPNIVYKWLTKLETRRKNQEKWLMSVRGLRFGSESCCSRVMSSERSASHLATRMRGDVLGGFAGMGSLDWFGLR